MEKRRSHWNKDEVLNPNWACCPGIVMCHAPEADGKSLVSFSEAMGMSSKEAVKLLVGASKITTAMSHKLSKVIGYTAASWREWDAKYRKKSTTIKKNPLSTNLSLPCYVRIG